MSFEEFFEVRFRAFLNENFRSPAQIAAAFGVRERTAENWLSGVNAPSGRILGKAIADERLRPSLIRHLTEDAA